jgi:hypothetical protein
MATGQSDINRARTHVWIEGKDSVRCIKCLLILPKETLVENVPACVGKQS